MEATEAANNWELILAVAGVAVVVLVAVIGFGVRLFSDVNVLKSKMSDLDRGFTSLQTSWSNLQNSLLIKMFDKIFESKSPIGLTEEGLRMAAESGIDTFINERFNSYKKQLDGLQTEVEIFNKCEKIAQEIFKETKRVQEPVLAIEKYFYNNAIETFVTRRIFSIRLRDVYLESRENPKK